MRAGWLLAVWMGCQRQGAPPAAEELWACPSDTDARWEPVARALRDDLGAAPGRVAAVVHEGALAWCGAFGERDAGGEPMTPTALLRIGSQTKSLTALLLLKLSDEGLLDLDAPMRAVAPSWDLAAAPGWSDLVTPTTLLTHTHGLVDYLEIDSGTSRDTWVDAVSGQVLYDMAPPGTFWNYSNPGYYLAGWLAEQAAGEVYEDLLRDRVLDPLGMGRTAFSAREVRDDGDFAEGLDAGGVWHGPGSYDNAWARPAGYLWSSVEDLGREVLAVTDAVGLTNDLVARWTGEEVSTEQLGPIEHYGLGWFVQAGWYDAEGGWRAQRLVLHGGDIPGFAADVLVAPDQRTGLVVLTNLDGAHVGPAAVQAWLEAAGGVPEPSEPPALGWDPSHLARAAGPYLDRYNVGEMVLSAGDDDLDVVFPLLDELDIPYDADVVPVRADQYVLEVQGFPLLLSMLGGSDAAEWARTRVFVARRDEVAARRGPVALPVLPEPWRLTRPLDPPRVAQAHP